MPPDLRTASNLSSRCRHEFSASARERGERYDDSALEVSCTCPHFDDGFFCKHLYAFLLELDAATARPVVGGTGRIDLFDVLPESFELVIDEANHTDSDMPAPARDDPRWSRLAAPAVPARRTKREVYYVASLDRAGPGAALEVQLFERADSGGEGRLRSLTVRPYEIDGYYCPEDEPALRALADCASRDSAYLGASYSQSPMAFHSCRIARGLQPLVIPLLARTGRLFRSRPDAPPTPLSVANLIALRWDGDTPYRVAPRLARSPTADGWQLDAELRGPEVLRLDELDAVLSSGLCMTGDRIVRQLQERKRGLAEAIVSGTAQGVRDLTREDLEILLG